MAAGLHTGLVHPHAKPPHKPASPRSTLEGLPTATATAAPSEHAASEAGDGGAGALFGLLTAAGTLDVDAVERHMLGLLPSPGQRREGLPSVPELDPVTKALQAAAIKVRGA